MGFEGFSGLESILYHLQSPCRVIELGEFEPIVREEWVPDAHIAISAPGTCRRAATRSPAGSS